MKPHTLTLCREHALRPEGVPHTEEEFRFEEHFGRSDWVATITNNHVKCLFRPLFTQVFGRVINDEFQSWVIKSTS